MTGLPQPPILVISDRRQASLGLAPLAERLLHAGCRWFSLREKDLPPDEQRRLLLELKPAFEAAGACLGVHSGDATLVSELGLGALHLPAGGDVRAARAAVGEGALIGISCHGADELAAAAKAGADYAALSPIFESASKPGYAPLGLSAAQSLIAGAQLPVIALGGIETPEKAKACRTLGAAGLAIMGVAMRGDTPQQAFSSLKAAWSA